MDMTFEDLYHEGADTQAFTVGTYARTGAGVELAEAVSLQHQKEEVRVALRHSDFALTAHAGHKSTGIVLVDPQGRPLVEIGGGDGAGAVVVHGRSVPGVVLDGPAADVTIGGTDNAPGDLYIRAGSGQNAITAEGDRSRITLGRAGRGGVLQLRSATGQTAVRIQTDAGQDTVARLTVGGPNRDGRISVKSGDDVELIQIRGSDGDIEFFNADVAELFDVAPTEAVVPGTVMVLREDGDLEPCRSPYASAVVGVVAGAGALRPALVLDKRAGAHRHPIAMIGKAYCRVDADRAPVRRGDLLTTSATEGHAMKATDRDRAFGSVIGKALDDLASGRGLVRTLINLH